LQTELAFERRGVEQIETGRVGQRVDELAVSELLNGRDADFDNGPQETREGGPEVAREPLVNRFQRPDLILAHALGALEVIVADLLSARGSVPSSLLERA